MACVVPELPFEIRRLAWGHIVVIHGANKRGLQRPLQTHQGFVCAHGADKASQSELVGVHSSIVGSRPSLIALIVRRRRSSRSTTTWAGASEDIIRDSVGSGHAARYSHDSIEHHRGPFSSSRLNPAIACLGEDYATLRASRVPCIANRERQTHPLLGSRRIESVNRHSPPHRPIEAS